MKSYFKNKKVIITGHTGFKGSWLTAWLLLLGARVIGISEKKLNNPSHFQLLRLKKNIINYYLDIRDFDKLIKVFKKHQPDFVFHLAAQALVKTSYDLPKKTFETNMLGTLNVLESLKKVKKKCTTIIITSDKVYKNKETKKGYKETDELGGIDPYSASKAGAELIIQSYLKSFFFKYRNLSIGIARAGNVIGGGDWSLDRLIPDYVKSYSNNKLFLLRNPKSTRPWQHVLEALWGYLLFSIKLSKNRNLNGQVFNFGPNKINKNNSRSVIELMKIYWKKIPMRIQTERKKIFHESNLLNLNSDKAKKTLNWSCILSFKETVEFVANWYKEFYNKKNSRIITFYQIKKYMAYLKKKKKINSI